MEQYRDLSSKEKGQLVAALSSNVKEDIERAYTRIANQRVRKLIKCHLDEAEIVSKY